MEIGLARRDLLGEDSRIPGLEEDVEPPALHLGAFGLCLYGLGHVNHGSVRLFLDEPFYRKLAGRSTALRFVYS